MNTVLSIRNVACPQTRPNATFRLASTNRAEVARSKIPAGRQQRPRRPGISPGATLRDRAFRARALVLAPLLNCSTTIRSTETARKPERTRADTHRAQRRAPKGAHEAPRRHRRWARLGNIPPHEHGSLPSLLDADRSGPGVQRAATGTSGGALHPSDQAGGGQVPGTDRLNACPRDPSADIVAPRRSPQWRTWRITQDEARRQRLATGSEDQHATP